MHTRSSYFLAGASRCSGLIVSLLFESFDTRRAQPSYSSVDCLSPASTLWVHSRARRVDCETWPLPCSPSSPGAIVARLRSSDSSPVIFFSHYHPASNTLSASLPPNSLSRPLSTALHDDPHELRTRRPSHRTNPHTLIPDRACIHPAAQLPSTDELFPCPLLPVRPFTRCRLRSPIA